MTAKEIFDNILPQKLSANAGLFSGLKLQGASIRLQVDGPQGGDWTVAFDQSGSAQVKKNENASATCQIQISDENFSKLISGDLNVPMALVTRKIKVSGDKMLAAKVGEAIRTAVT